MTSAIASARADLAALVDPCSLVTDAAACAALAVDAKVPDCAVAPTSPEQVAAVLRYANDHQLAVVARGSGTKLGVGNPPRRYDAAVSLRELRGVIHYEPADLTISVGAGMRLGEFQETVARNGLWLPLDPAGGRESSIGGIIAANAAGPLRQAFGGPRDMVLGLKIATAQGTIIKTGGRVVKNVAGYDLGKLMTGSFGTLGVIVEACVKLFPRPQERATLALRAGTLGLARDLRRRILMSPLGPLRLVLLDAPASASLGTSALAQDHPEVVLLVEVGGSHRVIERCQRELQQLAAASGAKIVPVDDAEGEWGKVSDLARHFQKSYGGLTVLKSALPASAGEEFVSRAQQEAEAEQIKLASFAQVGVGIVHLCLLQEVFTGAVAGLVKRLRQAAAGLGGTLVIEHCPSELKSQLDVWGPTGDDFAAMRKIKSVWDPRDVLSPGRFVGGI